MVKAILGEIRQYIKPCLLWLSCFCIISPLHAHTLIKSMPMQVSAEIKNGCTLNSSKTSGVNLGTIQFGTPVLNRSLEAASTENGGSIVLICTPGTSVSISLNAGSYSNNLFIGRKLKHLQKDIMLPYQLYQDRGYKLVWGEGENSRTITATGGKDVFTVYAKLFPLAAFPPPGTYQDIVTVTINY